jgi:murein DD-endopeptidase MepM/ murein hydrolase activator NlpD
VLAVGYHEAKNPQALPLRPLGRLQRNANRRNFTPVPSTAGPSYVVLKTRYRGTGPTTAVDVAMPVGARVLSPVTGRVRSVRQYLLYGAWVDYRVEIVVRRADLVVVAIHLRTVAVRRGARVVAGVTPIGRPRLLDYRSDIDEFVGPGVPHVHIEVKARRS